MGSVGTSILEDLDPYPRTSERTPPTPSNAKSLFSAVAAIVFGQSAPQRLLLIFGASAGVAAGFGFFLGLCASWVAAASRTDHGYVYDTATALSSWCALIGLSLGMVHAVFVGVRDAIHPRAACVGVVVSTLAGSWLVWAVVTNREVRDGLAKPLSKQLGKFFTSATSDALSNGAQLTLKEGNCPALWFIFALVSVFGAVAAGLLIRAEARVTIGTTPPRRQAAPSVGPGSPQGFGAPDTNG